jgi:hypothetical protein
MYRLDPCAIMDSIRVQLRRHRGDYGFDGGRTAIIDLVAMGAAGVVLTGRAFVNTQSRRFLWAIFESLGGDSIAAGVG